VPQLLLKQLAKAVNAASLLHEGGGVIAVTQVVQVMSLTHAVSWAQHEALRQASQVGSPVVKPQLVPPLELLAELTAMPLELVLEPVLVPLELLLAVLVLELLLLDEVVPQAMGYMLLGSGPPGGATQP
jgi:hypothetical protein